MVMREKHYRAIADILRVCGKVSVAEQRGQIGYALSNLFQREDRFFNQREFLNAAGLPR